MRRKVLPPRIFGLTFIDDGTIVGGAFVMAFGAKGEVGSIFLDPQYKHKGYGKQAMVMIEKLYPKVKRWKLDTLAESYGLHRFYESLGYIKPGKWRIKRTT